MGTGNQPGETTLYTSADGQALVTDKRLVLGGEQWDMANVAGAEVMKRKEMGALKLNSQNVPTIVAAVACLIIGLLFTWLASGTSGFIYALLLAFALILYLLTVIFIYFAWQASLPDVYGLKLTLNDPSGTPKEHRAAYTWRDQLQAREVGQAILQAVTRSNPKKTSAPSASSAVK